MNKIRFMCAFFRDHERCVADGSIASCAKRKGSPCQHDEHSLDGQIKGYSGSNLPEVQH
jgi:hypothetical protein